MWLQQFKRLELLTRASLTTSCSYKVPYNASSYYQLIAMQYILSIWLNLWPKSLLTEDCSKFEERDRYSLALKRGVVSTFGVVSIINCKKTTVETVTEYRYMWTWSYHLGGVLNPGMRCTRDEGQTSVDVIIKLSAMTFTHLVDWSAILPCQGGNKVATHWRF